MPGVHKERDFSEKPHYIDLEDNVYLGVAPLLTGLINGYIMGKSRQGSSR